MMTTLHPDRHGDVVLLWDVDNMPGGRRQLLNLAQALTAAVPPGSQRIAAARRSTYRRVRDGLSQIGFEVVSGGTSASGADRHLYQRARAYHRRALRRARSARFYVVSNDKYFTRVSGLGDVHLITLDPSHMSPRLAEVATTINSLQFDGSEWQAHELRHPVAQPMSHTRAEV